LLICCWFNNKSLKHHKPCRIFFCRRIQELNLHYISHFTEGLAEVRLNGKRGFINQQGNIVIDLKYDWTEGFLKGFTRVAIGGTHIELGGIIGAKWGIIDNTGKEIVPPIKYDWLDNFVNGFARVNIGVKTNEQGNVVIAGGKFGLIDTTGKEIVPPEYDYIFHFSEGLAKVNVGGTYTGNWLDPIRGGKFGFVNMKNEVVISPQYDDIDGSFKGGRVRVRLGQEIFWINTKGESVEE